MHEIPHDGVDLAHIDPAARPHDAKGTMKIYLCEFDQICSALRTAAARLRDPGISVRVLWSPRGRSDGVPFPPVLDDQPCFADRMTIDHADVHHAWVDSEWGPHEYAARVRDLCVMILIKPAPWTTAEWSRHVAETVLSELRMSSSNP